MLPTGQRNASPTVTRKGSKTPGGVSLQGLGTWWRMSPFLGPLLFTVVLLDLGPWRCSLPPFVFIFPHSLYVGVVKAEFTYQHIRISLRWLQPFISLVQSPNSSNSEQTCIALWVKARFKISFWNFVSHFIHIPIFQTEFLAILLCYFASKYSRAAMKIFKKKKTFGGFGG